MLLSLLLLYLMVLLSLLLLQQIGLMSVVFISVFFFFFVGDSVAKLFKTFPNVRSYIFQLFFCPSGKLFDILPWHGDNMLFLQMFH